MNKIELKNSLDLLKNDITTRPNDRSITTIISRYIKIINECIEYGFSRKDIYEIIFSDSDKEKIKFSYFANVILYRARLKYKKNNNTQTIQARNNDSVIETKEETKVQSVSTKKLNPLFELSSKNNMDKLHDNSSDRESLEKRMQEMLQRKKEGRENDR